MTDQPKFKPGDRVRRRESSGSWLGVEPGDERVVSYHDPDSNPFGSVITGSLYLDGHSDPFAPSAFELVELVDKGADERADAFDRLSAHPYFENAYGVDSPLIEAMVAMLDDEVERAKHVDDDDDSPTEQGWHTAPGALIDLTPQAALLASYGLEVRLQTRPKPTEAPVPTVAADVNLDEMREQAVRSGIEQAVAYLRRDDRSIARSIAAARVERDLLGDSAKGGE